MDSWSSAYIFRFSSRLSRPRVGFRMPALLLVLGLLLLSTTPLLAAEPDPCSGYTGKSRVTRFAGPHAFSKKKAETREQLQAIFTEHEADVWTVLKAKGLEDIGDALFDALRTGNGVSETMVGKGDTFEWMAFRKSGEPQVIDKICVTPKPKADKTWDAFEVTLVQEREKDCNTREKATYTLVIPKVCSNLSLKNMKVEEIRLPPVEPPDCALTADRSCNMDRLLSANATGSSEGVEVTLRSGSGTQTVIPNSDSAWTWQGRDESPYSTATFTASAQFTDRCGEIQRCEESVSLEACQRASCTITPSATEVRSSQTFSVDVSGHWAADGLEVSVYRGDKLVRDLGGSFPADVKLGAGTYTLRGSATNELGDTESCNEVTVEVQRRWTVRPALVYWDADQTEIRTINGPAGPTQERTKLQVGGSGGGIGVGLEYHVNDRVGLEGELQYVTLDSGFIIDLGEAWEMGNDDMETYALFVGPNFHLTPNRRSDFYVGPFVALVSVDDPEFRLFGVDETVNFGSEVGFGLKLGLDVPFGPSTPWAFHIGARYLDLSLSGDSRRVPVDVSLDPLIGTVGLSYSW